MSNITGSKKNFSNSKSEDFIRTIMKKRIKWYGISELTLKSIGQNDRSSVTVKIKNEKTKKEFTSRLNLNIFELRNYNNERGVHAA